MTNYSYGQKINLWGLAERVKSELNANILHEKFRLVCIPHSIVSMLVPTLSKPAALRGLS